MSGWGKESIVEYNTLDGKLQRVADRINNEVCDIRILVGHRGEQAQNLAYATNRSKVKWPNSKHNSLPSKAMDICPTPVNFKSQSLREELSFIAGAARIIAAQEGVKLRWGGDWDKDGDLEDNSFDDLFHLELED